MIRLKKIIISLLISFVVLSFISFFYYNVPVHSVNADGATDYIWEKQKLYIRTDDGIGYGKTNNEGYMNEKDYDGKIDILLMGSSHMEAQNIPLNKNVSSILNDKFDNLETYNIGVAGHSFKVIISNLDSALNKYKPKYVVLEASNLLFSDEYISNILEGNIDNISSSDNKFVVFLQKNPFLRLVYTQLEKFINGDSFQIDEANIENVNFEINKELNDNLLKYINSIANKYNAKVIIMYHPPIAINKQGEMIINTKKVSKDFSELCKENNIFYLDMSDRFIEEYNKNHIIPKGFINGAIATGHLNADGHRMIADKLYELIMEIEQ